MAWKSSHFDESVFGVEGERRFVRRVDIDLEGQVGSGESLRPPRGNLRVDLGVEL